MAVGKVKIDVDLTGEKAKSGIKGIKDSLEGLKSAGEKTGSLFKSVLGANLVSAGIGKAIGSVTSGVKSMISELNSSSKAWQTFEGNMQMLGKSTNEIQAAKSAMQDYATKTIYSASDMAQTYSQLAAVGIEGTDKLVTGFGGLAAAAENPTQAMKTLSTQAVQMAAKPKVAWQDFKLMLEQTPAGISAVAKEMGMSTSELVQAVQNGTVKTEDFFNAIKKVGNNEYFSKMATEFKSIDQAIDGAKESLANKLQPAFQKLNKFGIKAISGVANALDKINFDGMAEKLGSFLDGIDIDKVINKVVSGISLLTSTIKKMWDAFRDSGALTATVNALKSVGSAIGNVVSALANSGVLSIVARVFGELVKWAARVVNALGKIVSAIPPSVLSALAYGFLAIAGSIKAIKLAAKGLDVFKSLKSFNPFKSLGKGATQSLEDLTGKAAGAKNTIENIFTGISKVIDSAGKGIGNAAKGIGTGIKSALSGVPKIVDSLGKGVSTAAKGIGTGLATAFRGLGQAIALVPPQNFLALGAAIALVAAGLALLGTQGEGVAMVFTALGTAISAVITALSGGLTAIISALGTALTSIITALGTGLQAALQGVATVIVAIGTGIQSALQGVASVVTSLGSAIQSALVGVGAAATGAGNGIRLAFEGIASVVSSVGSAIQSAMQGVGSVIESVGSSIKSVLEGLKSAFEGAGNGIKSVFEGIGTVINSVGSAIKSVLDGIANVIRSVGESAERAGNGFRLFGEGIRNISDVGAWNLAKSLAAVAKGLSEITGKAGEMEALSSAMSSFSNSLNSVNTAATTTGTALQSMVAPIDSIKVAFETIPASITAASTGLSTFATAALTSLAGLTAMSTQLESFNTSIMSLGLGLTMAVAQFTMFGAAITGMGAALSGVSMMFETLNMSITAMSMSFTALSASITSTVAQLSGIGTAVAGIGIQITSMAVSVSSAMTTVSSSITSSMQSAVSAVQSACSQIISALSQMASEMSQTGSHAGQECGQNIANGLNSSIGAITGAMNSINSAMQGVARSGIGAMVSIGAQIGNGLAQGMMSALGAVTAAANALVAQAERAARAAAMIHSPSRLFARLGVFVPAGFAKGIEKGSPTVFKALGNMVDRASGMSIAPEKMLSLGRGGLGLATAGATNTVNNSTANNYKALLHIENFENHSKDDVRDLYKQLKFMIREEGDRLD